MELKDVILSTLAEMEEDTAVESAISSEQESIPKQELEPEDYEDHTEQQVDSELAYLSSIRERLLVLFEGFQAPNNSNIEAKIDMTLNFLEYTLATIDLRVQALEKGNSK